MFAFEQSNLQRGEVRLYTRRSNRDGGRHAAFQALQALRAAEAQLDEVGRVLMKRAVSREVNGS